MQVSIQFRENLKVSAHFDDFTVLTDQPIRYKGDGEAPSPFDYFIASSALCAGYFVKVYCQARDLPLDDIKIIQHNVIDPDNRYKQDFNIVVEIPSTFSEQHKQGILKSIDRCTVKRVIQNSPEFNISIKETLGVDDQSLFNYDQNKQTFILGKDSSLENSLQKLMNAIAQIGINLEISSWRNLVPHVWSVHIRDADSPMCYTNGKGGTKEAALCSALGEYIERISCNYFYNDYYLGQKIAEMDFVFYPSERWFKVENNNFPAEIMDSHLFNVYGMDGELRPEHLIDHQTGNEERGICTLPFIRQSDQNTVYIPHALLSNLYVSNGMSAGNSQFEARVQALSEIFERGIKNKIISEEISLPNVPRDVLNQFPNLLEGIEKLKSYGFSLLVKDASLGGRYPVACVILLNPKSGGVFASFGAHPNFEVALERSLTELLQGRSIEGLKDFPPATFNSAAVRDHTNLVEHFVDSSGVVSYHLLSDQSEYEFSPWNFQGSTKEEFHYLMAILEEDEKEVYIADYNCFKVNACRIIVPSFSEIYEKEDLIWENNNIALEFRPLIFNLQSLNREQLEELNNKLEESEIDNYYRVYELIGVAFDENTAWEQLTVIELKVLIHLALGNLDLASESLDLFFTYNECLIERQKFYQLISNIIHIQQTPSLEIETFKESLVNLFSQGMFDCAFNTVEGSVKFPGLPSIDQSFSSIPKHQKLLDSFYKLYQFRKNNR